MYYEGHIQITGKYSTIDMEKTMSKKNVTSHSIHLGFILHYITHTFYYINSTHSDNKQCS